MFCATCGKQVSTDVKFCPHCGKETAPAAQPVGAGVAQGSPSGLPVDYSPLLSAVAASTDAPPVAVRYASLWVRFCANLVDAFIVMAGFIAGFVVLTVVAAAAGGISGTDSDGADALIGVFTVLYYVVFIVGRWLYSAWLESGPTQATFGKRAMKIYVTDSSGRRLSFGRATGRHFAKYISAFTFMIGYLMAAFSKKSRRSMT